MGALTNEPDITNSQLEGSMNITTLLRIKSKQSYFYFWIPRQLLRSAIKSLFHNLSERPIFCFGAKYWDKH